MSVKLQLQNKIINGAMDYWQRGTSFPAIINNAYTADRWQYNKNGTVVHTVSQDSDVPSNAFGLSSLSMQVTTAQASFTGVHLSLLRYSIEGNILRSFKNKKMVMSFWVKSSVAGIYSVCIANSAVTRSLIKEFTIDQADTWEKITIRFSHDSSGAWIYDEGQGVVMSIILASGPDRYITPDIWTNTASLTSSSPNQVNAVGTIGNIFKITDVLLVEDNEGQTREPEFQYAGRDVFEELQLCQRYFEKSYNVDVTPGALSLLGAITAAPERGVSNGNSLFGISFKVAKRTDAVVTIYNPSTGSSGSLRYSAANYAVLSSSSGELNVSIINNTGGAWPASGTTAASLHYTSDAEF